MTAIRHRLLEVFAIEYQEHLEAMRTILSRIDGSVGPGDLAEATRRAHSLKGAARAVVLADVEQLAHALESLFIRVERGEAELDRDVRRHILDSLDEIEDRVVASQSVTGSALPASPDGQTVPESVRATTRPTASAA